MPIFSKDDEQYDESGMVAGMEQDFERVIAEKDKRIQELTKENKRLTDLLRGNIRGAVSQLLK